MVRQNGRANSSTPDVPAPTPSAIPNGYFTLTLPDDSQRTFRVWTQGEKAAFLPGKRLIGMLIGPVNTDDYEMFGEVSTSGVKVWKRFVGSKQARYAGIIATLVAGGTVEKCELLVSKRCLVCNRTLTDEESIRLGVGPTCRGNRK